MAAARQNQKVQKATWVALDIKEPTFRCACGGGRGAFFREGAVGQAWGGDRFGLEQRSPSNRPAKLNRARLIRRGERSAGAATTRTREGRRLLRGAKP